jgi:hypothetical protein
MSKNGAFGILESLRQGNAASRHAAIQLGNHMVDVGWRDVAGHGGIKEHLSRLALMAG